MLNLADLLCLFALLLGPFSGFVAARDCHVGVLALVLFTAGSLLASLVVSFSARHLAYLVLGSKRLGAGFGLLLFSLVSVAGLAVAILLPIVAASVLLGHAPGHLTTRSSERAMAVRLFLYPTSCVAMARR